MSNFLNLSTLSSARSRAADRFARLQDTPGGLLASFRSPSASAASGHSSLAPDGSGLPGGLSLDLGVGASGEFSALHVSGGGLVTCNCLKCHRICWIQCVVVWLPMGLRFVLWVL